MKELTIEQKAKAYDKALERAKSVDDPEWLSPREVAEYIFPELKESYNNRVRNKLIEFFKGYFPDKEWWGNITQKDILAWLEKQGEQKPVNTDYISGIRKELLRIEDNAKNINGLTESQWVAIRAAHRLLGEYITKEQKPAWSEEDEKCLNELTQFFENLLDCVATEERHKENRRWLNWLKSLRPQTTWKPSDEQFKLLKHIMENVPLSYRDKSEVGELYLDLKRLGGE